MTIKFVQPGDLTAITEPIVPKLPDGSVNTGCFGYWPEYMTLCADCGKSMRVGRSYFDQPGSRPQWCEVCEDEREKRRIKLQRIEHDRWLSQLSTWQSKKPIGKDKLGHVLHVGDYVISPPDNDYDSYDPVCYMELSDRYEVIDGKMYVVYDIDKEHKCCPSDVVLIERGER